MKERPILFSAPMILALLAGTKTQTRRIVKFDDPAPIGTPLLMDNEEPTFWAWGHEHYTCPFGEPGDRLWCRETWAGRGASVEAQHKSVSSAVIEYRADRKRVVIDHEPPARDIADWRPSIFMPRWASRITLEITEVRVQRLQEISCEDALAEGVDHYCPGVTAGERGESEADPRTEYQELWETINGAGSWALNPFVWALTFRIVPDGEKVVTSRYAVRKMKAVGEWKLHE